MPTVSQPVNHFSAGRLIRSALAVLLSSLSLVVGAHAQTVYRISPSGNDANSCSASQNASTARRTIASAVTCLQPGDTLLFGAGTYAGSANAVAGLPGGRAGYPISLRAETDGAVTITGGLALSHTNSYLVFEGLRFQSSAGAGIVGNHLKFLRCEFKGGCATGNCVNTGIGSNDWSDTAYLLFEDCWWHGAGGRYKVLIYRATNVVLRRVVVRDDGGWSDTKGDPEAGIAIYESSNVSCQNCLVIDSNLSTYAPTNVGAYYLTGHGGNPPSSNNEYLGSMAINNKGVGWSVDTDDGGTGLTLRDVVMYGSEIGLATSNTSVAMTIQRATIGGMTDRGIGNWGRKTIDVKDSVFFDDTRSHSGSTVGYSNAYNPADLSGNNTGLNPRANGLLYLPRVEDGTALKSGGTNNGQRGAQIVSRLGASGSLFGETGYNGDTGVVLWPWPNEARIKKEMCADGGVTRGFCSSTSLTNYIWSYLGNRSPIGNPVSAPPASPRNLRVIASGVAIQLSVSVTAPASGPVSGTVVVSASVAGDRGVAGVLFTLDGQALGAEDVVAPYSVSWNSPTSSNGAHTLAARVRDAAGNTALAGPIRVTVSNRPGPSPTRRSASVRRVGVGQEYLTIHAAVDPAQSGGTLVVFDGNDQGFQVTRSGTVTAPIIIKANGTGATYSKVFASARRDRTEPRADDLTMWW